ncbi:MAG: hypothetical protein INH13_16020 [Cupriavidus sp.]|nr:hypothetical protein [Cupriavidus sp.]
MIINISMISIAIMMMTNACAPRTDNLETVLRERLVRYYAEDDKAARAMNGEALRLGITFADLDGDGTPEAIVRLEHPAFCGSRGCAIDVIDFHVNGVVALLRFIAHEVSACARTRTENLCISVDGSDWPIPDGRFRPK